MLQRVKFAIGNVEDDMSLEKQIVILLFVAFLATCRSGFAFRLNTSASSRFTYTHFHWFAAAQFEEQPAIESRKLSNYVF
jgi:hypothetical protein